MVTISKRAITETERPLIARYFDGLVRRNRNVYPPYILLFFLIGGTLGWLFAAHAGSVLNFYAIVGAGAGFGIASQHYMKRRKALRAEQTAILARDRFYEIRVDSEGIAVGRTGGSADPFYFFDVGADELFCICGRQLELVANFPSRSFTVFALPDSNAYFAVDSEGPIEIAQPVSAEMPNKKEEWWTMPGRIEELENPKLMVIDAT